MKLRYALFLVLALLIVGSATASEQDDHLLSAEFSRCIDQAGGVDPAMLDCIAHETKRQDKRLNDAYRKLMNQLKPVRKRQLQEAQRVWLKYVELNCSFYHDPEGGTAATLAANECPMLARAQRAKELEAFIQ